MTGWAPGTASVGQGRKGRKWGRLAVFQGKRLDRGGATLLYFSARLFLKTTAQKGSTTAEMMSEQNPQNRYIPPDAPRCPRCGALMEERGVREDELTTRLVPLNPQNRLFGCGVCGYPVPRDFHAPPPASHQS